jgi:hypothetical protein
MGRGGFAEPTVLTLLNMAAGNTPKAKNTLTRYFYPPYKHAIANIINHLQPPIALIISYFIL